MSKPDYYELLQVSRSASDSELKASYRKLAFQFHPDRNPDDQEAEEQFKLVSEAYDVLSDEKKRRIYDQFGHDGLQGAGSGFGGGFSSAEDIFSSFGDIFEDFFGGGRARGGGPRARRGPDQEIQVEVDFLESCFGGKKQVDVSSPVVCETCEGSGAKKGTTADQCGQCGGRGQVQMTQGFFAISTTCPACHGQGQIIKERCEDCRGGGRVQKRRKLDVKVPAGIADGMRLLMQGQGGAGENGGPSGDLYVYVRVQPHDEFRREDDHILSEMRISYPDLVLGKEVEVNTIDGPQTLKIRKGTPAGEILKIRGAGVANVRSGARGDHLFHVQVEVPTKLSSRQKELIEELQKELSPEPAVSETESQEPDEKKSKKKKKKSFFGSLFSI